MRGLRSAYLACGHVSGPAGTGAGGYQRAQEPHLEELGLGSLRGGAPAPSCGHIPLHTAPRRDQNPQSSVVRAGSCETPPRLCRRGT